MDSDTDRLLVPYDEARRMLGDIGRTTLYELLERREIVRVNIGRRGFVTARSLAAYVDRLSADALA
ncbi:hypothetical protein A5698_20960 [Mycobacterium sp. E136]|uniref:hypothetical protein n=1 Tax=Mycobacterium sp. E136 TaxID=1834125 RepID=UPI0007FFA74E|nr:hypothetical protein [Mycobacterium sp. E136]OBG91253.1 hypothetical protein A5698_20960 [Mycobacterium sp. E136]